MSPGIDALTGGEEHGAKNQDAVSNYVRNGFLIGVCTGLIFGIGGSSCPTVMSIMSKDADTSAVIDAAHSYLQISLVCASAPLYVLTFALQGLGDKGGL